MIKNKNKFIFLTLFIAYTSVYIARVNLSIRRCNKTFRLPSHVCFVGGYLRFVYIHSDCNQQKFGCARIAAQTAAAALIEYSAFADLGKPRAYALSQRSVLR